MRAIATILTALALAAAAVMPAAAQQPYPNKPVTIVVPYAPGGVTDVVTRMFAAKLTTKLGTQFNVENRIGGNGMIGTDYVARARPDGYTLCMFLDSNTIAPALVAKLGSDPIKDFTPITMLAAGQHIVVAHPSFAPNTIKELVDYAKAKPGEPYASAGQGTAQHLGMEMIKMKAGVNLTHIPYKGGGQAITDIVSGQVKVAVMGLAPVLPFIRSGQLKVLALTGEKRTPLLPGVPTVNETLPGVYTLQWFGVVGPAGMPKDVVDKLYREFVAVSKDPEIEQKLAGVGLEVRTSAQPADLVKFMEEDLLKWPPIVKAAGLKIE